MQSIKEMAAELVGLFVDDGTFALAILVWLVGTCLLLPQLPVSSALRGAVLFAGFASILVENALRRARR